MTTSTSLGSKPVCLLIIPETRAYVLNSSSVDFNQGLQPSPLNLPQPTSDSIPFERCPCASIAAVTLPIPCISLTLRRLLSLPVSRLPRLASESLASEDFVPLDASKTRNETSGCNTGLFGAANRGDNHQSYKKKGPSPRKR